MNATGSEAVPNTSNPSDAWPKEFFGDPSKLMRVLGDRARWIALRELAYGKPRSLVELAGKAGRTPNQMGKHLAALRKADVAAPVPAPDGDGRKQCHAMPDRFIRSDADGRLTLDFGVSALRFGDEVRTRESWTAKD